MPLYNQKTIGEAIGEFLKHFKLEEKLTETKISTSWEKVMGQHIAKYTKRVALRNKVLYVYLDSSALRNELSLARQKIVEMINKEAGKKVIDDVVFQ